LFLGKIVVIVVGIQKTFLHFFGVLTERATGIPNNIIVNINQ